MKSRKPNRLREYDYSKNGYYFVTICTQNLVEWFGKIENDQMVLNEYGQVVLECWHDLPNHYRNIKLDESVIMPNHIHGIIIIENNVGNRHACSLQMERQHQILPVVIGSYKSAVARYIHQTKNGQDFHWQKSFYDHVIRNENELAFIREYILNNPRKWDLDTENMHVGAGLKPATF